MTAVLGKDFIWCVGVEDTFIPQTRADLRALDEYELMDHYRQWRSDFDLAASLGVSHIRWGVPWYRVNPEPGKFDWRWVDTVIDYLVNVKGLQPIVDLMHYGTPFWLQNAFINSSYPERVAEYAFAFASRYKDLVRFYTPLNEPTVNAEFCGKRGEWPPYLVGEDGYVKVLLSVARGTLLTAQAIRAAHPQAILIQVEALGRAWTADERLHQAVEDWCEDRYLGFDLISGAFSERSHLWGYLQRHGVVETQIDWFRQNGVRPDVLGVNFYPVSGGELVMGADGSPTLQVGLAAHDLAGVLRSAWERYRLPMMLTETGITDRRVEVRRRWMDETVAVVREARMAGIPMLGYTWWPLFDMVDWAYRLGKKPLRHYIFKGGLWTCKIAPDGAVTRSPNSLADRYRSYVCGGR